MLDLIKLEKSLKDTLAKETTESIDNFFMTDDIISFCNELKAQWELTKDLRLVSQWTYEQREAGRNIPYMSIAQTEKAEKGTACKVIGLWASPTVKQKALKTFFSKFAPNCDTLTQYTLRMYLDEQGLLFQEKIRNGKNILFQSQLT
jgi:hypothetical protein